MWDIDLLHPTLLHPTFFTYLILPPLRLTLKLSPPFPGREGTDRSNSAARLQAPFTLRRRPSPYHAGP